MGSLMENLPKESELTLQTIPNADDIATILRLLILIPDEMKELLQGIPSETLTFPPTDKEWSVVQNLAHIRSCADIWGDTIDKMIALDNPTIAYQSPRSWYKFKHYSTLDFWFSFQEYQAQRIHLHNILHSLQSHQWERKSTIKDRSHTIYSQCRRLVLHELVHFYQIKKAIYSF